MNAKKSSQQAVSAAKEPTSSAVIKIINRELRGLMMHGCRHEKGLKVLRNLIAHEEHHNELAPLLRQLKNFLEGDLDSNQKTLMDLINATARAELMAARSSMNSHPIVTPSPGSIGWNRNFSFISHEEDMENFDGEDRSVSTPLTSDRIRSARSALVSGSPMRLTSLRRNLRQGNFGDFRIIPQLLESLNDPDEECARFIGEEIIPQVALRYAPSIARDISPIGSPKDIRSFRSLAVMKPREANRKGLELYPVASEKFRAEIIFHLARQSSCLELAIRESDSSSSHISSAAIKGLAYASWENKYQFFGKLFQSGQKWKNLKTFWRSFSNNEIQSIIWERLNSGLIHIANAQEVGKKILDIDPEEMADLVGCLNPSILSPVQISAITDFFERRSEIQAHFAGSVFSSRIDRLMHSIVLWLADAHEINGSVILAHFSEPIPADCFEDYFFACLENLRPDTFFDQFHQYYFLSDEASCRKTRVMEDFFCRSIEHPEFGLNDYMKTQGISWDPRWKKLAAQLPENFVILAVFFASPETTDFLQRFWNRLERMDCESRDFRLSLRGLLNMQEADAEEFLRQRLVELHHNITKEFFQQTGRVSRLRAAYNSLAPLCALVPQSRLGHWRESHPDIEAFGQAGNHLNEVEFK